MKTRDEILREVERLEMFSKAMTADHITYQLAANANGAAEVLRWVLDVGAQSPADRIVVRLYARHGRRVTDPLTKPEA